jgi:hypothetical protein
MLHEEAKRRLRTSRQEAIAPDDNPYAEVLSTVAILSLAVEPEMTSSTPSRI